MANLYTDEQGVYDTTGFSSDIIQELSGLSAADVTTLVGGWIADATEDIEEDIRLPYIIRKELHLGDGDNNQFDLGPYDDLHATIGDYDPADCLSKVHEVWFGSNKMKRPYPLDCELGTDIATPTSSGWTYSAATVTAESTIKAAGSYSVKAVFSGAGYIEYHSSHNLEKNIDMYSDVFFWLRISSTSAVVTLRLYDKDGNYTEETVSSRQASVGQYHWIDIDTMTDGLGDIDWDDDLLQYYRVYVSGACTLYLDNLCFADNWAFTAPVGILHTSVADNISGESPPSEGYPIYATYSYDPFLASTPSNIKEACEWLSGIKAIEYLRGIKYSETDFRLKTDSMEPDTPMQKSGVLGLRDKWLQNYERCLKNYGGGSYGVV